MSKVAVVLYCYDEVDDPTVSGAFERYNELAMTAACGTTVVVTSPDGVTWTDVTDTGWAPDEFVSWTTARLVPGPRRRQNGVPQ